MNVGRYYLKRRNYLAAINRFKKVVSDYQTTKQVEEALMRLTEAYMALGIVNEAQTAAAVLGHNFPQLALVQGRLCAARSPAAWRRARTAEPGCRGRSGTSPRSSFRDVLSRSWRRPYALRHPCAGSLPSPEIGYRLAGRRPVEPRLTLREPVSMDEPLPTSSPAPETLPARRRS